MRNRARCEANRRQRLMAVAEAACRLPRAGRTRMINRLYESHDWQQATLVTRTTINTLIQVWSESKDGVALDKFDEEVA